MTITLNLTSELEEELSQEAARLGVPLAEYALRVLANSRTPQSATDVPLTGADLVEYWSREGVIGSRRDVEDPVAFARALREQSQHRTRS